MRLLASIVLLSLLPISVDFNEVFPSMDIGIGSVLAKSCSKSGSTTSREAFEHTARVTDDVVPIQNSLDDISYQKQEIEINKVKLHDDISNFANHIGVEWKKLPDEELKKFKLHIENRSQIYTNLQEQLFTPVRSPVLLNLMPINKLMYKNIYKTNTITSNINNELKRFEKKIHASQNIVLVKNDFEEIKRIIESTEDDTIVILSHSEGQGVKIVMPNGKIIDDKAIHRYCAEQDKVCVILTCHGDDFGITNRITAGDALSMWNSAISTIDRKSHNKIDFIYQMRLKRFELERNKRNKIFISISASATGGVTTYYYTSEQK